MTSEIPLQPLPSIRQRILSLCILKFALITVILGAAAFTYWISPHSRFTGNLLHRIVIGLVVFEYLTLLAILALLHRHSPQAPRVFFLSIFIDILLTTLLVYLTGNASSPYIVLYMVGIISAALVMPVSWAVIVTFVAMGMYLFVAIAGNAGILDWLGNLGRLERLSASELASRLGVHGSAMAAVSVLSITLARHILQMEAEGIDQSRQIRILFNRHQDVLRSLSDGVLCVSHEGRILDVNPAFCTMLGIDVRTGDSVDVLPAPVMEWVAQKPYYLRTVYSCGKELELELSVQKFIVENHPEGFILVVRDRSEQARLERDLARKEKLAALGRLTASIAHEIRNPLTSIAGSLELLKPAVAHVSPENQELFDIVFREIRRLNTLLAELRQYTSERRRNPENIDLVDAIRETVRLCEQDPRYEGSRFQLEIPETCPVRYDPDGLRQVLINLSINAVQAAPGKTVTVRVADAGGEVLVDIEDEGPGVPPDFQEKIFEPFVSTKQSGTGLGLAIASQIAAAHGGKVQLVRTGPSGTCMRLVIVRKSENR